MPRERTRILARIQGAQKNLRRQATLSRRKSRHFQEAKRRVAATGGAQSLPKKDAGGMLALLGKDVLEIVGSWSTCLENAKRVSVYLRPSKPPAVPRTPGMFQT
ncbi:hypothetical protein VTO42DRAFT_5737 [Malbranchea cinnamomea]